MSTYAEQMTDHAEKVWNAMPKWKQIYWTLRGHGYNREQVKATLRLRKPLLRCLWTTNSLSNG